MSFDKRDYKIFLKQVFFRIMKIKSIFLIELFNTFKELITNVYISITLATTRNNYGRRVARNENVQFSVFRV